jgi:hypothetical protein
MFNKERFMKVGMWTIAIMASFLCATAQAADPNIETEGNMTTVKRAACLSNGGSVGSDKRYFICEGGKYDGIITEGPASTKATCAGTAETARAMIAQYGTPDDAKKFNDTVALALKACRSETGEVEELTQLLDAGKAACSSSTNRTQRSEAVLGTCELKVIDIVLAIIN